MEKLLNGKAIYSPKGKAGEYAKYACNFYVGCSNDCDYTITTAKQSLITDIVPMEMSQRYASYAKTHEWMMDGMRVGMDASNL